MKRVCPNPIPWNEAFKRLNRFAAINNCLPAEPPIPLILMGWVGSNNVEKRDRWNETVQWAINNGCIDLIDSIQDKDFYFVEGDL